MNQFMEGFLEVVKRISRDTKLILDRIVATGTSIEPFKLRSIGVRGEDLFDFLYSLVDKIHRDSPFQEVAADSRSSLVRYAPNIFDYTRKFSIPREDLQGVEMRADRRVAVAGTRLVRGRYPVHQPL